jgi:hypothetical protein
MVKIRTMLIKVLVIIMLIAIMLLPLGLWIVNPDLTRMQILIKYWWILPMNVILGLIAISVKDKKNER